MHSYSKLFIVEGLTSGHNGLWKSGPERRIFDVYGMCSSNVANHVNDRYHAVPHYNSTPNDLNTIFSPFSLHSMYNGMLLKVFPDNLYLWVCCCLNLAYITLLTHSRHNALLTYDLFLTYAWNYRLENKSVFVWSEKKNSCCRWLRNPFFMEIFEKKVKEFRRELIRWLA